MTSPTPIDGPFGFPCKPGDPNQMPGADPGSWYRVVARAAAWQLGVRPTGGGERVRLLFRKSPAGKLAMAAAAEFFLPGRWRQPSDDTWRYATDTPSGAWHVLVRPWLDVHAWSPTEYTPKALLMPPEPEVPIHVAKPRRAKPKLDLGAIAAKLTEDLRRLREGPAVDAQP